MDAWAQNVLSAAVGITLGVIIEDPLTRLRDKLIHRYKQLFYKKPTLSSEEFTLGNIQTHWLVVDGTGEEEYSPETILTHFEDKKIELSPSVAKEKQLIDQKQKELHKKGETFSWNGDLFSMQKFLTSRVSSEEKLMLELWFRETDYYSFLATNTVLEAKETRDQVLPPNPWQKPLTGLCNSLGINLAVITDDEYLILTKRSERVGTYQNLYHISVNEGLSRTLDRGVSNQAPDVYRCAIRGIAEELGVIDVIPSNISLLSFGVDTEHAQWGILGTAKINKTAEEVLEWRNKGAKDKWETSEVHTIKFQLDEVVKFIAEHPNWTPAGITCLYHTLIHEFKRKHVEEAIKRYLG